MSSSRGNGYLRQGEFRRWAASVDGKLDSLTSTVAEHSELLAVFKDRKAQDDASRTDRNHARVAIVTAVMMMLTTLGVELWHIFEGVK